MPLIRKENERSFFVPCSILADGVTPLRYFLYVLPLSNQQRDIYLYKEHLNQIKELRDYICHFSKVSMNKFAKGLSHSMRCYFIFGFRPKASKEKGKTENMPS